MRGLPDFGTWQQERTGFVMQAFEEPRTLWRVPQGLKLASCQGRPDLRLDLVRPSAPGAGWEPYGRLDLRLEAEYSLDRAATVAAAAGTEAATLRTQLSSVPLAGAILRFRVIDPESQDEPPEELAEPRFLSWNGLGAHRIVRRLSALAGSYLVRVLEQRLLSLQVEAVVVVEGVAPRLPGTLRLGLGPVAEALRNRSLEAQESEKSVQQTLTLPRKALQSALEIFAADFGDRSTADFGQTAGPESVGDFAMDFATVLADQLIARYGALAAAPSDSADSQESWWQITLPEGLRELEIDFRRPTLTQRAWALAFDPIKALEAADLDRIVNRIRVPAVTDGFREVEVVANLPLHRRGLLEVGARLEQLPSLPIRPQGRVRTVLFEEPQDSGSAAFRFHPLEEHRLRISPFALLQGPGGRVEELLGPSRNFHPGAPGETGVAPGTGEHILVDRQDLPLHWVSVAASPSLLSIAVLQGHLESGDGKSTPPFRLDTANPRVTLASDPAQRDQLKLRLEAQEVGGEGRLELDSSALGEEIWLDLSSFPAWGAHQIELSCSLATGQAAAFDLQPLGLQSEELEITTLLFHPGQPKRTWRWFAASPFAAGFRWRFHPSDGQPDRGWNEVSEPGASFALPVPDPEGVPA